MKRLLDWIEQRTGLGAGLRNCVDAPVPGGACVCKVWPCTILFCFCVQAITGFVVWMHYSPSAQTAWESVYFLQHHVAGGWLLRAVHHYSAQVMLVLIAIYIIQMVLTGAYRAPRELVFWTVVFMGLLTLGLMLTGDLLTWDQNSFASTQVRVSFLTLLPAIGGDLYKLAAGGPAFGHLTLTRFVALHIGLFSACFLGLLLLHGLLARRANVTKAQTSEKVTPFWPNQALLSTIACLVVLLVILALASSHGLSGDHAGVALGAPADPDPTNFYAAARPEWAFLGLYEFSHQFPGELMLLPIFVIPTILVCLVLAMPWIGRFKAGHRFNMLLIVVLLLANGVLSWRSVARDRANPEHQAALAVGEEQAARVLQLARSPQGIPATGALTLLKNDPKTQGPILFTAHCSSCHDYADAEGQGITAEESSAPNLFGYPRRQWFVNFLDPKNISGPDCFGNTKFKSGDMASFVKELFEDLEDDEIEELKVDLAKVAAAVSAEAALPAQQEADRQDTALIEEGRQLMLDDFACIDCHKFHDKGAIGNAPELTGYGSRPWLLGIISDPTHKRFYGESNDRMPAYAETLSEKQLGLLVDWLRGEWYEE